MVCYLCVKQKTAYEMRISDWSSDVCSSDLRATLNDSTPIPTVTEKDSSMTRQVNIGIGEEDRVAISEGLSRLLADTYTLYLTSHNFHWNVTGPMFNSLHLMFMTQYTELWNAVDPIAERIRSLGQPAPGSYAQFAKPRDRKST